MKYQLRNINEEISNNKDVYIEECEKRYKESLSNISKEIVKDSGRILVMLAGPSSSGKTTTAELLKSNFEKEGREAITVSLDDFYLNQNLTHTFEDGTVDYETIKALDVPLISDCLKKLLDEGSAFLPRFSFISKSREESVETKVGKDDIIIVEGLHAINPLITDRLADENVKKLYVSVSSRIYDGEDVLFSKRDMRFIRRLIRDFEHRNSPVDYTFYLWNGVRKGEDRYLFPFSNRADIRIDSIHPYEPCVFKDRAMSLLSHIESNSEYYEKANELSKKLEKFVSIPESEIPAFSLLNEFTVRKKEMENNG